jgi:hypothetical protein
MKDTMLVDDMGRINGRFGRRNARYISTRRRGRQTSHTALATEGGEAGAAPRDATSGYLGRALLLTRAHPF